VFPYILLLHNEALLHIFTAHFSYGILASYFDNEALLRIFTAHFSYGILASYFDNEALLRIFTAHFSFVFSLRHLTAAF
jgi:hypothetical protein